MIVAPGFWPSGIVSDLRDLLRLSDTFHTSYPQACCVNLVLDTVLRKIFYFQATDNKKLFRIACV